MHDHWAIYRGTQWEDSDADGRELTDSVVLARAPGHTSEDIAVIVGTGDGLVVTTHCWFHATSKAEDEDPEDADQLHSSRAAILEVADRIVPGHGPPGGEREVRELQSYLRACVAGTIPPGPWDTWLDRDRDAINIERAALLAAGGLVSDRVYEVAGKAGSEPLLPEDPNASANRRLSIVLLREAPPAPPGHQL